VWVLTFPMLAEVCDYDEIRTGVRREGVYTAMYNWGCKVAIAMIGVVGGAIVQLSGFDQHLAHQTESTIQILRWSFALGPIPFFLVCMVLTLKFPLSAESNQRLREEKARGAVSAPPRSKAMAT
jgi:GPH family glycoside/pentoside/hexuronide:cation symporter